MLSALREPLMRQRLILGLVGLVALLILGPIIWKALPQGKDSVLAFDWPESDRESAMLEIDGKRKDIPAEGPMKHACESGSHRIVVTRPGFDPG